jgi:hypothetical protein
MRKPPWLKAALLLVVLICAVGCAAPDDREPYPVVATGSFETRLIPLNDDNQPLWDQPATIGERMGHYRVPGIGIAVIDDIEIVWAYPETGQGVVIMTNSATGSLIRFEILLGIALERGWPLVS